MSWTYIAASSECLGYAMRSGTGPLLLYSVDVNDLRSNFNQERGLCAFTFNKAVSDRTNWPLYR